MQISLDHLLLFYLDTKTDLQPGEVSTLSTYEMYDASLLLLYLLHDL